MKNTEVDDSSIKWDIVAQLTLTLNAYYGSTDIPGFSMRPQRSKFDVKIVKNRSKIRVAEYIAALFYLKNSQVGAVCRVIATVHYDSHL